MSDLHTLGSEQDDGPRADQFPSLDPFDWREPGRCAVVVVSHLPPQGNAPSTV